MNAQPEPDLIEQLIALTTWLEEVEEERNEKKIEKALQSKREVSKVTTK